MPSEYKYSKRRMFSSQGTGDRANEGSDEKAGERTNDGSSELNEIEQLTKHKMDYNHNGLIANGVENSTVILLANIQAKEQKRSAERSLARRELFLSSRNNFNLLQSDGFDSFPSRGKPTRSVIEHYLSQRLLKRKARQNARQQARQASRTIIIDQPSQSLARVTFNFNGNRLLKNWPLKQPNKRQARLLSEPGDGVVLDHLLLAKSFVLQKN